MSTRKYCTHFTTSVAASSSNKVLHSPYCSLPWVHFTQVQCLHFLPTANKLAAPKLDAIPALQAATIVSFSPDTVTFAILLKEVGFMGQATSHDKCL